jgi:hypothetical protein
MKTSLRVIAAAMFAVATSLSLATAHSARKDTSEAQKASTELLTYYSEVLNRNTVTIISGTPAGTYLAVAYDMSEWRAWRECG